MKTIYKPKLIELLPDSVLYDPKLRASAEALSSELEKLSAATWEVLHLPRLDELHGEILDYLAEQFHLDFYEPLYLTEAEKKNLIRESIAWHRIKGTPAAVEKIAHDAFRDSEVVEWFEYGGEPYHFKIKSKGYKQTPDGYSTFVRMVNAAKNTRSWLDNFEVDYSDLIEPVQVYVGDVQTRWGLKEISLARPPNYKTAINIGSSDFTFGNKTISLHQPRLDGIGTVHVGQFLEKWGRIVIAATPSDIPPYLYMLESPFAELLITDIGLVRDGRIAIPVKNYWQRQEADAYVDTSDFICGLKTLSLPEPRDEVGKSFIGQGYSFVGLMSIAPEFAKKRLSTAEIHVGQSNLRVGLIKIASSTKSSVDPHKGYVGYSFKTPAFAGTGEGIHGVKEYSLHVPDLGGVPTVHIGQVITRLGDIKIDANARDLPAYFYGVESPLAELLLADNGLVRDGKIPWPVQIYDRTQEAQNYIGQIYQNVGQKIWSLAPPRDEETEIFFGQVNHVGGDVKISPDTKIKREYPIKVSVGQTNWRQGKIRVDSTTKAHVEENQIIHVYTTDTNSAATANFRHGGIFVNPAAQPYREKHLTTMRVGQVNLRSGFIKIQTADKSSVDPHKGYVAHDYRTDSFTGVGAGAVGFVSINPSIRQLYRDPRLVTVRVGVPFVRAGEIKLDSDEIIPWDEFPDEGDWLRLWFNFPNRTRRTVLLSDPREDLETSDIRAVGDSTAKNDLLLNSDGETTTGITRAALITRKERKIL